LLHKWRKAGYTVKPRGPYIGKYPPGGISADVTSGKKHEKGREKGGKYRTKKQEIGKKKRKYEIGKWVK
jgi:hypothetical protein